LAVYRTVYKALTECAWRMCVRMCWPNTDCREIGHSRAVRWL